MLKHTKVTQPHRYRVALLAGLIVVSGLLVRIYGLDRQGLHCEELFTIPAATGQHYVYLKAETALKLESFPTTKAAFTTLVSQRYDRSLKEVTDVISQNVHMPVYFYFMHYWIKLFGVSETALRLPSVIFGTLAILMFFLLSRELLNPFSALISALLMAFMPEQIFYSQEARMYSLLVLLAISSTYVLILATKQSSSTRLKVLYCLITLAGIYTHYGFVFCFAFQTAFVWVQSLSQKDKRLPWKWIICQVAITAGVLPWVLRGLSQKRASPEILAWARANPTTESVLSSIVSSMTKLISTPEIYLGWLTVVVAYLLLILGIVWLWSNPRVLLLIALWLVIPLAGIVFVDVVQKTRAIGVLRYWMVISPAIYMLIAAGVYSLKQFRITNHRVVSTAGLAALVLFLAFIGVRTADGTLRPKPDRYRELVRVIETYTISQRKEAIFTEGSNAIALAIGYYGKKNSNVLRAAYVMEKLKSQNVGEVFGDSDIWLVSSGESNAAAFLERSGYKLVNNPIQFGHITLFGFAAPRK